MGARESSCSRETSRCCSTTTLTCEIPPLTCATSDVHALLLHDDLPRGAPAASHAPTSIDVCTLLHAQIDGCAVNACLQCLSATDRLSVLESHQTTGRHLLPSPVPRHPHVSPFFAEGNG